MSSLTNFIQKASADGALTGLKDSLIYDNGTNIQVVKSLDGGTFNDFKNDSTGTSAVGGISLTNDVGTTYLVLFGSHLSNAAYANATNLQANGPGNIILNAYGGGDIVVRGASIEIARFKNDGKVGIGTATPHGLLDLGATTLAYSQRLGIKLASDTDASTGLVVERVATDSSLWIGYNTGADGWQVSASYGTTGAYKPLTFWTSSSEQLRIDTAGKVGIGTTAPDAQLHIKSNTGQLILQNNNTSAAGADLRLLGGGTDGLYNWKLGKDVTQNNTFQIIPSTAANGSIFSTAAISIQDTGNVGIGTTGPSSKLSLNGSLTLGAAGIVNAARAPITYWDNPTLPTTDGVYGKGVAAGRWCIFAPTDYAYTAGIPPGGFVGEVMYLITTGNNTAGGGATGVWCYNPILNVDPTYDAVATIFEADLEGYWPHFVEQPFTAPGGDLGYSKQGITAVTGNPGTSHVSKGSAAFACTSNYWTSGSVYSSWNYGFYASGIDPAGSAFRVDDRDNVGSSQFFTPYVSYDDNTASAYLIRTGKTHGTALLDAVHLRVWEDTSGNVLVGNQTSDKSLKIATSNATDGVRTPRALWDGDGHFYPAVTATYNCGTNDKKWLLVRAVTVTQDDLQFENGWTVTESHRVGIADEGLAILDAQENLIVFIGSTGFYTKGGKCLDTDRLPYVRTTKAQRARMDRDPTTGRDVLPLPDVSKAAKGGPPYVPLAPGKVNTD